MKKFFVTGASGFIGSHLVDRLLADGHCVVGWDNFSTGQRRFLSEALQSERFRLVTGDNLDLGALSEAMRGSDFVFHLAANADVRFGLNHPERDLQQNTVATFHVLEAMRSNQIKGIAFSSTGSVYGETEVVPTPEAAPFPIQTSLYGASKVACEGLIQSYCEGFGFEGYIFRFVSILGERYSHGHVFDFCKQLIHNPTRLDVLGDGTQTKSYLYVGDCVSALIGIGLSGSAATCRHRVDVFNLGTDRCIQVRDSIKIICAALGVSPVLHFSGGTRGWIGDNPTILLDTQKARGTGWCPQVSIEEGVSRTVEWLRTNQWIYETRS